MPVAKFGILLRDIEMTEKTIVNLKYELEDYENNKRKGPALDMKGIKYTLCNNCQAQGQTSKSKLGPELGSVIG